MAIHTGVDRGAPIDSRGGRSFGNVIVGEVIWVPPDAFFIANGVAQDEEDILLPRNALVDDFKMVVQALPASRVPLSLIAQVRDGKDQDQNALIIDFGSMVSVAGLSLPDPAVISGVKAWTGAQFATQFTYPRTPDQTLDFEASFTEIRTERLLVRAGIGAAAALKDGDVFLTDSPSGLELRIDGGPPVWTHPAAVRSGSEEALSEVAWNDQSQRLVDVTAALKALTGDPLAPETLATFKLTLSARLPCLLTLTQHDNPSPQRIRRVKFEGSESTNLVIASEGRQTLSLPLPALTDGGTRLIKEVRMTAAGAFPPDRTLPPVGPEPALAPIAPRADSRVPVSALVPVAELVIDPGHAICIRPAAAAGLAELLAVRLPLAVGLAGAELRVTVRDSLSIDPAVEVVSQTSDPVTRDPGAEAWTSFVFKKAYALDPAAGMPWLVITAARGEATLAVAQAPDGVVDLGEIRRGPPGGPWQALPSPLTAASGDGGVIAARGRVRLVGLPPKAAPLAPVVIALQGGGGAEPVTPTAKGVEVSLEPVGEVAAETPVLELTARAPGNLTLSGIDVVTAE